MVRVNSDNNSASDCTVSQANSGNSFANGLVTTINYSEIRPRKKTLLFPEMQVSKKMFTQAAFFFNVYT